MADTTDTATATTAAPPPQENTTAAAAAAAPAPPPPREILVPKTETKRWGDEEDDEPLEDTATSSTSQPDKVAAELNVEALTIDDTKSTVNKYLDEPQDAHITAVLSISLSLSHHQVLNFFICLILFRVSINSIPLLLLLVKI